MPIITEYPKISIRRYQPSLEYVFCKNISMGVRNNFSIQLYKHKYTRIYYKYTHCTCMYTHIHTSTHTHFLFTFHDNLLSLMPFFKPFGKISHAILVISNTAKCIQKLNTNEKYIQLKVLDKLKCNNKKIYTNNKTLTFIHI